MLVLVACFLTQFSAAAEHPGAESFEAALKKSTAAALEKGIADTKAEMAAKSKLKFAAEKKRQAELKARLNRAIEMKRTGEITMPLLHPDEIRVGAIGDVRETLKVVQVLGNDAVLCDTFKVFVIRGIDTSKMADGDAVFIPETLFVFGTYTYQNTMGARKTVLALEPWKNRGEYRQLREKAAEKPKPKTPDTKPATKAAAERSAAPVP